MPPLEYKLSYARRRLQTVRTKVGVKIINVTQASVNIRIKFFVTYTLSNKATVRDTTVAMVMLIKMLPIREKYTQTHAHNTQHVSMNK